MLARFFKPKWQHAKPAVRLKAVAKLNAKTDAHQEILGQLALQDLDEQVRLAATEKLSTLPVLLKISRRESVDSVRQQALHRISQLLLKPSAEQSKELRLEAVAQIQDCDLLCHIALNTSEMTLATEALTQLRSDQHLFTIARQSSRSGLRIQATEKINCPDLLEQLNKHARSHDKKVFQISRDKLQLLKDTVKQQQQDAASREDLLAQLTQLAESEYSNLYNAKLQVLQQEWALLEAGASSDEKVRYLRAQQKCQAQVDHAEQLAAAEAAQAQAVAEQAQMEQQLLEQLEDFNARLSDAEIKPSNLEFLAAEFALIKDQSAAINCAQQRLKTSLQITEQCLNAWHSYQNQQSSIEQHIALLESAEGTELNKSVRSSKQLLKQLAWPDQLSPAPLIMRLEKAIEHADQLKQTARQDQQEKLKRLEDRIADAETSLKNGQSREASKKLLKAERALTEIGSLPSQLEQRMKQLADTLAEQQDWQAFAVTPKKVALCESMEALIDSSLDPETQATRIRELQQQWKQLDAEDPVHDQQIWKRFKKAADRAYAPCSEFFAEQREIRSNNLILRQQICDELTALLDDPAPAARQLLHSAKHRWRQASPVDRAPGKALQQRFNELTKALEEKTNEQGQAILAAKASLVEQSAQLLKQGNLQQAAESAKQLQQEWKNLGPAPRKAEQPLWQAFRENCNQVFVALQNSTVTNVDEEALLQQLKSLQELPLPLSKMEASLNRVEKALANSALATQFQQAVATTQQFIQTQKRALMVFATEPFNALKENAQLCEQVEDILLEGHSDTAYQLLTSGWQDLSQLPELYQTGMLARRNTLLTLIEQPERLDEIVTAQDPLLRELCIRMEILCQQPTPAEDQPLRMEYQLQRLQQALEQPDSYSLAAVQALEYEWLCQPFCNHFETLHQRFYQHIDALLEPVGGDSLLAIHE